MNYKKIVKNNNPVFYQMIKNIFVNKKLSHAYILSGSKNNDLSEDALFLSQVILSDNPFESDDLANPLAYSDLHQIGLGDKEIKKEDMINVLNNLQETTLDEKGIKILIINNIQNTNKYSLNSLLKFLEEPTKNTYIIMTTTNLTNVLDTIKSRSQIINIRDKNKNIIMNDYIAKGMNSLHAKWLSELSANAQLINNEEIFIAVKDIEGILKLAINKPDYIITNLAPFITKKNYVLITEIILIFMNDIWKSHLGFDTTFDAADLLVKYHTKKFNHLKAIMYLNEFLNNISSNVNFQLGRSSLLINLRGLYE